MVMRLTILVSALVIALMIGAPSVYAEQFGHQYYWGWRDGYWSWVYDGKILTGIDDDEGHPPNYWTGVANGTKYAQDTVMVKQINGSLLIDYNAAKDILDWFDGQTANGNGDPIPKAHSLAFADGYNAPYGTLPSYIDDKNLTQTLSGP
jgi:hypothetical protein